MGMIRRTALQLAAASLLPVALTACAFAEQYRWEGVSRVVAMSDPHGAYDSMVQTLVNAGVVDESAKWSGGDTHLVITGDMLDRGAESRKIMDLVMRLEQEAPQSGGMVHLTLGNHEVMNLVGDLRYVASGEYAAFSAEETEDEREQWFARFHSSQSVVDGDLANNAVLRAEFDKNRPPGFFAHRRAFSSTGKYGRWLLQKPIMVVVNDSAFVHGGLPPMVAEFGLQKLNDELRLQVRDYVEQFDILSNGGLMDPATGFYEHPEEVSRLLAKSGTNFSPEQIIALQTIVELNNASVHDQAGPLWYRGSVTCSTLSEGDVVAAGLEALGVNRIVVGHTPTVTRRVLQRFDGRVVEIDTGMLKSSYRGVGSALIIEGDSLSVVGEKETEKTAVIPHPRRVGARPDALSASVLEQFLANGDIVSVSGEQPAQTVVTLSHDGRELSAVFVENPRKRGLNTELAAYRLDRLLGLDMVPVTVAREVNGKAGTLQYLPNNTRNESDRAASGRGSSAHCPLRRQWNSMYIFDALTYNESRAPQNMIYSTNGWQLMLMGHEQAFSTKRSRPRHLETVQLELTGTWVEALNALSNERLADQLGDVLDKRRIAALGKRRDALLRDALDQQ